jgi:Helix-turn-helix
MDQIVSVDLRAETEHSHSPAPSIPRGSCGQNGHIPAGASCGQIGHIPALPMSPYRLSLCLIILGWSERELARRTGEHRTTIRRWLAGESEIDSSVAKWLEVLVAVHVANPGPRRKHLSILDGTLITGVSANS